MATEFLSSWRMDITTLGPVHVGSGEELEPTKYVLDSETQALFEFPTTALTEVLRGAGQEQVNTILGIRALIDRHAEELCASGFRALHSGKGIEALYKKNIASVAQGETGAINQLIIEKTAVGAFAGTPLLPGSSLKGAIRTALLNQSNKGQPLRSGEGRSKGTRSRKLQERLFDYRRFENDPMRLVHIADATSTAQSEESGLAAETTVTFAVNRKKNAVSKDGRELQSRAQQQDLYQMIEVTPALRWHAFRGGLTLRLMDSSHNKVPNIRFQWTAKDIAKACNEFYRGKFLTETQSLLDRGLIDQRWYGTCKEVVRRVIGDSIDSSRAFLLRVGRHSGAESVTLDGVRDIKIMKGPGNRPDYRSESSTWWLASDDKDAQSNMVPFGWLLIELTEGEREADQLNEVTESLAAASGFWSWRQAVRERHSELGIRMEERRQEARRRERRIEEERERAEEELRRRESMSAEERQILELRDLLEKSRGQGMKSHSGLLTENAVLLLRRAESWSSDQKAQAADAVAAVYEYTGFPKGKKGRQRKDQIAALRGR